MNRTSLLLAAVLLLSVGCNRRQEPPITIDVLNAMTPVKNQDTAQTCWIYAMLAAIETEHIGRGDSVNLSAAYVEKMLEREPEAPASHRGMGLTCISLIQKYGLVPYDAMPTAEWPAPRWAFMLGAQYTPGEFARSVCGPHEYVALTSNEKQPYYTFINIEEPDNWMHHRFLNVPMDTLLLHTERAVRAGHGVCWESRGHAMAIVGLGHRGTRRYFVMKNSWGTNSHYDGLEYVSYGYFKRKSLAVEMTREAWINDYN